MSGAEGARRPGEGARRWHREAYAAGVDFVQTPGPIGVVLGAGASLTSKCPTTRQVEGQLEELIHHWAPRKVRDVLYRVPQTEIQTRLEPLFTGASPYIGYLSLAAVGRRRRVHVLNLNWDPMVEDACQLLGIPYMSFDLRRPPTDAQIAAALPSDGGILVAHVHGRLGQECRYDYLSTLKLTETEREFVSHHFAAYPRLFAGVSLLGDSDLVDLLWNDPIKAPTWFFGRGFDAMSVDDLREVLPHRSAIVIDDEIDFDDLMVIVAGKVLEFRWDDFRAAREPVPLPSLSQIAWPRKTILRPLLTQRVCPLVNATRTGKSTVAHLLAYLKTLWYADVPVGDYVRTFKGARQTIAALSAVSAGDSYVLVLEDVFGAGRFDDNPTLVDELERVAAQAPLVTVIVTSRIDRWQEAEQPRGPTVMGRVWQPRGRWYERARLKQLARAVDAGDKTLAEAIDQKALQTPAQISDYTQGLERSQEAAVEEKLRVLDRTPDLALVCALVRFARYRAAPVTVEFIAAQLGVDVYEIDFAQAFLHDFPFEGERCLTLGHDEDVEAVDCYLRKRGVDVVRDEIAAVLGADVGDPALRWAALEALERGDVAAATAIPSEIAAELAPDLLRSGWRHEQVVDRLIATQFDGWSLLDLAYELVRLWRRIGDSPRGHALLERVLGDREAHGAYAILEACLYLPHSASDEIWARLNARLWELLDDEAAANELALVVDALLWRPPERETSDWLNAVTDRIGTADVRWALWRFVAAYHPIGTRQMIPRDTLMTDSTAGFDTRQRLFAADLVAWHFVHQSRARATLSRQPGVDKDFLCRSTYNGRVGDGAVDVERLVRSLADEPETAAWAFHVVCNIMSNPSALPITDDILAIARKAIATAPPAHPGVISAAVTYESARTFARELRAYFAQADARDALLDVLATGFEINGVRIAPPRFIFALNPDLVHAACGVDWPGLNDVFGEQGQSLAVTLLAEIRRHTPRLIASGHEPARVRAARIRVERGDYRACEGAVFQRQPAEGGDEVFQLFELAVLAEPVPSVEAGRLF